MTRKACLKTLAAMAESRIINYCTLRSNRKIGTIRSAANRAWSVIFSTKMTYQCYLRQFKIHETTINRPYEARWAWGCRKSAQSHSMLARRFVRACSLLPWPAQLCNTLPWSSSFQLFATSNTKVSRVMRLAFYWRLRQPVNLSQVASQSQALAGTAQNGPSSLVTYSWSYQASLSGCQLTIQMPQTSWRWPLYSDSRLVLAPASYAQ